MNWLAASSFLIQQCLQIQHLKHKKVCQLILQHNLFFYLTQVCISRRYKIQPYLFILRSVVNWYQVAQSYMTVLYGETAYLRYEMKINQEKNPTHLEPCGSGVF